MVLCRVRTGYVLFINLVLAALAFVAGMYFDNQKTNPVQEELEAEIMGLQRELVELRTDLESGLIAGTQNNRNAGGTSPYDQPAPNTLLPAGGGSIPGSYQSQPGREMYNRQLQELMGGGKDSEWPYNSSAGDMQTGTEATIQGMEEAGSLGTTQGIYQGGNEKTSLSTLQGNGTVGTPQQQRNSYDVPGSSQNPAYIGGSAGGFGEGSPSVSQPGSAGYQGSPSGVYSPSQSAPGTAAGSSYGESPGSAEGLWDPYAGTHYGPPPGDETRYEFPEPLSILEGVE